MNPNAFIFIGRSGCGKGTQAELLKNLLEKDGSLPVFYVETGDKFRSFFKLNSYASNLSKAVYEKSDRQPDFLGSFMWSDMLINDLKEPSHLILDGVARSVNEAKILETALSFFGMEKVHIFHLNVSREWSEGRLKERHRYDDTMKDGIRKRLDWFDKDVVPVIEYFKNSGNVFVEINGEQEIEKVHADIRSAVASIPA